MTEIQSVGVSEIKYDCSFGRTCSLDVNELIEEFKDNNRFRAMMCSSDGSNVNTSTWNTNKAIVALMKKGLVMLGLLKLSIASKDWEKWDISAGLALIKFQEIVGVSPGEDQAGNSRPGEVFGEKSAKSMYIALKVLQGKIKGKKTKEWQTATRQRLKNPAPSLWYEFNSGDYKEACED